MAKTYTLEYYEELAYEFAIRNPSVIKLLQSPLNDEVADELLKYGIDITIEESYTIYVDVDVDVDAAAAADADDNMTPIGTGSYKKNSLQELYLDYPHLGDNLKNIQISHKSKMYKTEKYRELFPDAMEGEWKGDKKIVHPRTYCKTDRKIYCKIQNKESDIAAFSRINAIAFDVCMNEGSKREGVKRDELKNGDAFNYYDEKHCNQKSTTYISNKYHFTDIKTIKKYIKFIEEWVFPEKYLKLIPQTQSKFMKIRKNITEKNTDRYY